MPGTLRPHGEPGEEPAAGRLAVPTAASVGPPSLLPGPHRLVADGTEALVAVPAAARGGPVPLVVMLHGAGGRAEHGMALLGDIATEAGAAVLAPSSHGPTWDVIAGGFGPDVATIGALLADVWARVPVDPGRIVLAGFSDGASYALSLGLVNGDRVGRILAFSPGFAAAPVRRGRPAIHLSHGVDDAVLPIDRTSRRLEPLLRRAGHDVRYREFPGGHVMPPDITRDGLTWALGS